MPFVDRSKELSSIMSKILSSLPLDRQGSSRPTTQIQHLCSQDAFSIRVSTLTTDLVHLSEKIELLAKSNRRIGYEYIAVLHIT